MASIHGTIRIGEAQATAAATARRLRGGTWPYWLLMTVLWGGGAVAGAVIGWHFRFEPILCGGAGALAGVFLFPRCCRLLSVFLVRKTMTGKGTPVDMPVRLDITPDAFVHEMADVQTVAKWRAVTEVFHAKGYWIFMVQGDPWFAPDHFFQTDDDTRAFLAEALSHMSQDAQARSSEAVKFAARQDA